MTFTLSSTPLEVSKFTCDHCFLVILKGMCASLKPEFFWGRHPDFLYLEFTKYRTLVLLPRSGIRGLPREVLHPFASTFSVLAAIRTSITFSSSWLRGFEFRARQPEATLNCAPRTITVFLQLAVQNFVVPNGCLLLQSDYTIIDRRVYFII